MIRLFYNYYEDKNPVRKAEIDLCYKNNLDNKLLTVITLNSQSKITYEYVFQYINQMASPDDISIWCNSDIFFDETISLTIKLEHKELWALARWEWKPDGSSTHFFRPDSQDAWMVRGKIENVKANFLFGIPGSDNKLAYQFKEAGYKISNPSKTVKTYHVHNSNIRTYSRQDAIPGPYYTLIPTDLI